MKLISLQADTPLVKTFLFENDKITKTPYPNAYRFISTEHTCNDIKGFYAALEATIKHNGCLLKGTIDAPLRNESRAGSTDPQAPTEWLCLDIDGLNTKDSIDKILKALDLDDVSYIVQYSSSSYITTQTEVNAHIFMLLSDPVPAPLIKQWLTGLNLRIDLLRKSIRLTRTGHALHWPLDITCCQNDKLIYVSYPTLTGDVPTKIKFKAPKLISKTNAVLPSSKISANFQMNKSVTATFLNQLRKLAGLSPIRPAQYKYAGPIAYVDKPDEAILTGLKEERGFVYLNLNGGDSWGYYHSADNPEFIHNFKGEPAYKTKDLLPAYWNTLVTLLTDKNIELRYFIGRDFNTDRFFNGMYNTDTKELTIARTSTEARLMSFLKQHGQPVPDFVQDWTIGYFPDEDIRFDEENHIINTYIPSEYYKLSSKQQATLPPVTKKIIESAVGTKETLEHFLNWLACIVQKRTKTQTCWVLHGVPGTGKGLLMHNIITPILGASNTRTLSMTQLEERYNGWAESSLVTLIDEVQIKALYSNTTINANLKSMITDSTINVRKMYSEPFNARSYVNLIFASNQPDPVIISSNDRRFNVGMYQEKSLKISSEEVKQLASELTDTYMYLATRDANLDIARQVIQTKDRQLLINISMTSIDSVANHVLDGDLDFFIDQLPTSDSAIFNTPACMAYRELITGILNERDDKLLRDELFILFDYCIGDMPRSPHKFTSLLKHHRIYTTRVRRNNNQYYGIQVKWKEPIARKIEPEPATENVVKLRRKKK